MESFRKENTESKNSQLWLGWLDLNQRMSVSKTDTLNHLATPHHGTPHRIRTDTLQILNLLPAANWASGALSWPYYYYPILAYLVSNPIHRAMENITTLSQWPRHLSCYLRSLQEISQTQLASWRRDWDSNPRTARHRHRFSRPAH